MAKRPTTRTTRAKKLIAHPSRSLRAPSQAPFREWIFIAAILCLIVVFFAAGLFGGKSLFMRDMVFDFIPQHVFAAQVIKTGHLPLWSEFSGFGKPFAADPQTATFYPLHLLFYALPSGLAVNLYCVLHLWIAGAGMYSLARHWKLDPSPALCVAVACIFSTWMVCCMEFANNFVAVVWAPWILLVSSMLSKKAGEVGKLVNPALLRLTAMLALLFVMQYLSGYAEFVAYTVILAFAYVAIRSLVFNGFRAFMLSCGWFGLAGFLALLITTPQFLASVEFLGYSERAQGIDPGFNVASVHPRQLFGLLLPFINGYPGYPDKYWAGTVFEYWIGTAYVGVLPLMMLCLSILWFRPGRNRMNDKERRFHCTFLYGAALFGLLMAFGKHFPLYGFLYKMVPGFDHFRFPSKFLVLVLFSFCLLSGFGYQSIRDFDSENGKSNRLARGIFIFCASVFGILLVAYLAASGAPTLFKLLAGDKFPNSVSVGAAQLDDLLLCLAFLLASTGAVACLMFLKSRWRDAIAIGVVFANLYLVGSSLHPLTASRFYDSKPDNVLQIGGDHTGEYRVYSLYGGKQQWLYANPDGSLVEWATTAGVGDSWLPHRIHQIWQGGQKLMRYTILYDLLGSLPPEKAEKLADILGIRYVVGGEPAESVYWRNAQRQLKIAERPNALPRAFVVEQWIFESDEHRILNTLMEQNPRLAAVVEPLAHETVPFSGELSAHPSQGKVQWVADEPNRIKLEISAAKPSLLILNDAWYPGWKSLVDGISQPVFRVNYHFRGVFFASGRHDVELVFSQWQFRAGMWVSLAGVAILGLMMRADLFLKRISIDH